MEAPRPIGWAGAPLSAGLVLARQFVAGPWRGVDIMKHEEKKQELLTHRVITMLDREELEFLDKMGKDALFSTGHKLSYNEILKGLIDFAMEMGVSGERMKSLESLKEQMMEKLRVEVAKLQGGA